MLLKKVKYKKNSFFAVPSTMGIDVKARHRNFGTVRCGANSGPDKVGSLVSTGIGNGSLWWRLACLACGAFCTTLIGLRLLHLQCVLEITRGCQGNAQVCFDIVLSGLNINNIYLRSYGKYFYNLTKNNIKCNPLQWKSVSRKTRQSLLEFWRN